jgi:hypothetical protein
MHFAKSARRTFMSSAGTLTGPSQSFPSKISLKTIFAQETMTYLESDMHEIARHVVFILYQYIYDMEGTGMDTQQLEFGSYHAA